MSFYERYEAVCRDRGIEPCAQKTAELLNTTRANISAWKKGTQPNIGRLRAVADGLRVSADYLLERTDDPTDYVTGASGPERVPRRIIEEFARLDAPDAGKVEAFLLGVLSQDKYKENSLEEKAV